MALASLVGVALLLVTETRAPRTLGADPVDPLADTDDDLLPDAVEWAVLTDYRRGDTDRDGLEDFLEVVQYGAPRRISPPLPPDHEMRVVVTSVPSQSGEQTWLHLLFRFMGDINLMTSFEAWFQTSSVPAFQFPLSSLASGQSSLTQRDVPGEGRWFVLSMPMVSTEVLTALLPCTIGANAMIGGRQVRTAVKLFDMRGTPATLVPTQDRFAVQSIGAIRPITGGGSNKICLIALTEVGNGPAGVVYQVIDADCDDCNDLECGVSCPETVGWIFVLPGGVGAITGG